MTYRSSAVNLAQVIWSLCAFGRVWISCAVPLLMFQKRMSFKWVLTIIVSDQERSMLLILEGQFVDVC